MSYKVMITTTVDPYSFRDCTTKHVDGLPKADVQIVSFDSLGDARQAVQNVNVARAATGYTQRALLLDGTL